MWLGAGHLLQQVDISVILVLSSTVNVVQSARDLGVTLDSQLSRSDHLATLCRSGFYQLRQIRATIRSRTFVADKTVLPGVYSVSPGLVQLAVVWCTGVLAAESPVGAKRRRSSTHGAVTTSLQCCVNFTVCRSSDEWNVRLRVSYTNRSLQRRQRTCLPTFNSSPIMVVLISVHLLTEHWLFH